MESGDWKVKYFPSLYQKEKKSIRSILRLSRLKFPYPTDHQK